MVYAAWACRVAWVGVSRPSARSMGSLSTKIAEYRKMWKPTQPRDWDLQYKERFIPFSKSQLVSTLLQELHLSNEADKHSFLSFVERLDASLLPPYYSVMERLQGLYDPINPDRDTLQDTCPSDAERLSHEQQVLEELQPVLEQANFNSISEDVLAYALTVHHPQDGVQVQVNLELYEYIQFWALGQRVGPLSVQVSSGSQKNYFYKSQRPPVHRRYFKRVLVAARPKNAHLVLKSFKDIPLEGLEQLLPVVKVRTSSFDRTLLNTMLLVSGMVLFVNVGMVVLTDLKIGTSLLLFLFAGFMTFRVWKTFAQRRRAHSLELAHMLYYRSTSNNAELLGALTMRAQEEHAKEVILAQSFLMQLRASPNATILHECPTDVRTMEQVKAQVESWLQTKTGLDISFNIDRAFENLQRLHLGPQKETQTENRPDPA